MAEPPKLGAMMVARGLCLILTLMLFAPLLVSAQRTGGEIRRRTDDQGREYFEVFADHINGNHSYPVPMRNGQWPKRVTITAESTWTVATGVVVNAQGASTSCASATGKPDRCPAPNLPWGALLARWVTLDIEQETLLLTGQLSTKPISDWFLSAKQNVAAVPIPTQVSPHPHKPSALGSFSELGKLDEYHYTPLVVLQFVCNDASTAFGDNDGWLHIYEHWEW